MKLWSIEPTVFYQDLGSRLGQQVRVTVEAECPCPTATLSIRGAGYAEEVTLNRVEAGVHTYDVLVPEITEPGTMMFALGWEGEPPYVLPVEWVPHRHWEVYLVHYSHHDLGYTDLPSRVLREYEAFYDDALRYCDATADWPEEAKFHYLVEQAWSLLHWVENRPAAVVERLMAYVRSGQVEVTALFGNQTLELCGHETLVRLLAPAASLADRYGFEIVSAEHNDIPGFPWALASILRGAGIRYFSPGVPRWYFGDAHPLWDTERFLRLDRPDACWWEGPDGARVLLWSDLHGQEWQPYDTTQAEVELPALLLELEAGAYPYEMVSYTLRGGHRDNAPPTMRYAELVRAWNARWVYPRLINATNRIFLSAFEDRYGDRLPVFRGDVPGTDYPVAATCTPKETAVIRRVHDHLPAAETLATLASEITDCPYPHEALEEAYRATLTYDLHCWGFHDPGGPAQDAHWAEKSVHAYRAAALAHDVAAKAVSRLADALVHGNRVGGDRADDGAALVHTPDTPSLGSVQDRWSLVVFNTLGQARTSLITAPLRPWDPAGSPMFWQPPTANSPWPRYVSGTAQGRKPYRPPADMLDRPFDLVDAATGERLPYQIETLDEPRAARPWAPERAAMTQVPGGGAYARALTFVARDLPPIGYRAYRLEPRNRTVSEVTDVQQPGRATVPTRAGQGGVMLETPHYRVRLDSPTGALVGIVDLVHDREVFDHAAPHMPGVLVIRDAATGDEEIAEPAGILSVERGQVFSRVRGLARASCCPRIVVETTAYQDIARVDVAYRILRDAMPMRELYVAFPFAVPAPVFHFEAANAIADPIRDQVPGSNTDTYAVQHWVTVDSATDDWSVTWSSLDTPIAELGGLWPGYVSEAHHGATGPGYGHPFLREGELTQGYIYAMVSYNNFRTNFINAHPDEFVVRYSFTTSQRGLREASSAFGWGLQTLPEHIWMPPTLRIGPPTLRVGPLTLRASPTQGVGSISAGAGSWLKLEAADGSLVHNVIVLVVKLAEDGEGVIVRLWETAGRATEVTLRPAFFRLETAFVCDLVERRQEPLAVRDGTTTLRCEPYGVVTVRLQGG